MFGIFGLRGMSNWEGDVKFLRGGRGDAEWVKEQVAVERTRRGTKEVKKQHGMVGCIGQSSN